MFSEQMILVTLQGLGESLYMTLLSTLAVSYTHLEELSLI